MREDVKDYLEKRIKTKVKLIGENGNAFSIISKVKKEMRDSGYPKFVIKEYEKNCTRGDYNNLLQTTMRFVDVS